MALAEDDIETALGVLTRSREAFMDLGMPFHAARAQVLLGVAARRAGDHDSARLQLTGARECSHDWVPLPRSKTSRRCWPEVNHDQAV